MLLSSLSPIFVQKMEIVCDVHILFTSKSNQNKTNSEHLFIDKRQYTSDGSEPSWLEPELELKDFRLGS